MPLQSSVAIAAAGYEQRTAETRALELMLNRYCQREHSCGQRQGRLCIGCLELHSFVVQKLPACPSGEQKTACVNCQQSCMPEQAQRKLQQISRVELPVLMLRHPLLATRYWLKQRKAA